MAAEHPRQANARPCFQAMAAMGKVWFETGADVSEYLSFPAGKHDDEVDTASLIGRALDMAHPATVRTPVVSKNPPDLWGKKRREGNDWKTL
jgi:hypothetical protein